ncbi:MAG: NAD-dependent epimerase/dehydratase family protein [Candidatus Binatia bacterium]
MATLITGIGLVGTSFAQRALHRGERLVFYDVLPRREFLNKKLGSAEVAVVQNDIRDLPALIHAMQEHRIDTVVHTVGLIGGRVAQALFTGMQINVMGTINVAEAVRLTGVKRLIHISTMGVYDRRREGATPIPEDFPRGEGSPYGNSKVAKELMLETYQRVYGFELIVLRLANVYGFGHFSGGSSGGETIQRLLQTGIRGGLVRIPQAQARDFEYIYYKDVGRAIDLAATVSIPPEMFFNIGTGVIIKSEELVGLAKRFLPKLQVEILPGKPPRSSKQPMVIARAKEHLGWEPEYNLESGFQAYIEDLKSTF